MCRYGVGAVNPLFFLWRALWRPTAPASRTKSRRTAEESRTMYVFFDLRLLSTLLYLQTCLAWPYHSSHRVIVVHKTSLTPTLYWSACAKPGMWAVAYMCVRPHLGVSILSLSTIFRLTFWFVPTMVVFFCCDFFCFDTFHNLLFIDALCSSVVDKGA